MTSLPDLRHLADPPVAPPFGFEQFQQRRAIARRRRRTAGWSAAAALGVLAVVPVLAVLTQPEPAAQVLGRPASELPPLADLFQQPPALVDMDRFAVTSELEDYIALLDAQISAAQRSPVPNEQLRRLEATRAQLHDSLKSVSQAHAMLDL
jgi:hypothetical protein